MYMIHTCPKIKWYVDEFLIPSMTEQGISRDQILEYNDEDGDGCLISFMNSWRMLREEGTWHLQDDVVISSNFKRLTEVYDDGIVCGFCNSYASYPNDAGCVGIEKMWYSFPCIRIPNDIMKEFVVWFTEPEVRYKYKSHILSKKHVDVLFWDFLKEKHRDIKVLNLIPNIVNHIDHLIGGSLINGSRDQTTEEIMAMYWNEPYLIVQLERELKCREK